MARLSLTLLGPLHCGLDGAAVQFKTKLAQALLVYLVVEAPQALPRETLAALLWPDQPENAARHNLRQTLLYLRQALPDATAGPFLQSTRQTIQFNTASDDFIDVAQFSAHLEATRRHPHTALGTCAACMARLAEAATLYRGDFLAQFYLEDNQPFEEWALARRESLRARVLEALYQLADHHAERGDLEAAARYARRQVELDNLREEGYQQWMRAASLHGRRSEALSAYDDLRRRLDEELSVAPAAATTALYEQIVEGRLAPSPAPAARPPPLLPRPLTLFVGREVALAEIHARLDDSRCALLTLVGPGGVGKTTLALEVARQRSDRYRDGVAFAPLASLASPDHLATAIGAAVELEFTGKSEPTTELLAHLRAQQRLLVLDNFEALLASEVATKLLLDLLQAAPEVQLLVTSRELLNLRAEWLYEVSGLPYPPSPLAGEAQPASGRLPERYAAVRLFMQQAHRLRHTFAPDTAEQAAIGRLCRLVEGLPLAIELAAALTRVQTCEAIAAAVERNLDSLTTTQRDVPARQRSLRALFDYSWELLAQPARGALSRLAVFHGGLTVEAASQVAHASQTDLARLADKSVLSRRPEGRYELHEVLRQYALEKLAEDPAVAAATRVRHADFYTRWVQRQESVLAGEAMAEAVTAILSEVDNVRAAWAWAVAQGDLPAVARSLAGLSRFYVLKSLTREGEAALSAAVAAVRARLAAGAAEGVVVALFDGPEQLHAPKDVLAALLVMHGRLLARLSRVDAAAAAFAEGIALAQAQPGRRIQALGYAYWGLLESIRANYPSATAKADQALALAQDAGWVKVEADALRLLGNIGSYLGDLAASRRYYERCLPLEQATGDKRGTSASLSNLGGLCLEQGDWAAAEGYFEQALALHRELGDQVSLAQTLMHQGQLAEARGDFARAAAIHAEALGITQVIGDRQHEPDARLRLGLAAHAQGRSAEAHSQIETALALYRELGDRRGEGGALEAAGTLAEEHGALEPAVALLESALVLRRSIDDRLGIAATLAALGTVACRQGRYAAARTYIVEALATARANQATPLLLRSVASAAALLTGTGQAARAAELLACVLHHASTESQTRAGARRQLAEAALHLPEPPLAAAQARGRQLELDALALRLYAELAGLEAKPPVSGPPHSQPGDP